MSDRIGLRTSQNIPEFSSAWMRAYDAHVSEVKALQKEVKKQHAINLQQGETIKRLKQNIQRMKQAVKLAKAKVQRELSFQRKLKDELSRHGVPIPLNFNDVSSSSDETDDCTQSTSTSPTSTTATSLFNEAYSSPSCSVVCTKSNALSNKHEENTHICSSTSPPQDSGHEKGEKNSPIRQIDECPVYGKGSLQLSSLQKLSRIKYHNINKVKHCSTKCEVSPEKISSDLPSPSLLHAPKVSSQLENSVQIVDSEEECTDNNSVILLNESQCSSDTSHAFMPVDLRLKRKRKYTSEEFEQSDTEDAVIVHECLTQFHTAPTMAIVLPKAPGGSDSDLLADKSFFTTVKKYKCKSSGNDRILYLADKTSTTAGSDCSKCSLQKDEAKFGSATAETKRFSKIQAANADLAAYSNTHRRGMSDALQCRGCKAWYSGNDHYQSHHLKETCCHKQLYHQQNTDPKMWDISFPNSEECDEQT